MEFWDRVAAGPGGCIIWTGGKTGKGYGQFRRQYVHRLAYEMANGPIPAGLQIDHTCMTKACVNYLHLEAVTQKENLRRASEHYGRNGSATACPRGHAYDEANTRLYRGERFCRTCARERARRLSRIK